MASRLEERLRDGPPLVGDGGMGALVSAAVPGLRCPEEANLRAPESVVSVHVAYIRAGAELIETNTFGANRPKLAAQFLEDEFERINSTAVRLAREAREVSGKDVFIGGAIGPLGDAVLRKEVRAERYAEQAGILEGRGVDLFMVETFYDLDEIELAIAAVRSVSSLPIVALMTFDEDGQTLAGVTAAEAGERLRPLGLAAIGANHGAGPASSLHALQQMRADGTVLAALPNVGLASLAGSRVVYPHATPEYFGEFAAQARELGAGLIGGCCGTTPMQIEAIAAAISEQRAPAGALFFDERALPLPTGPEASETQLQRMFREGEFVLSIQLDPPLGGSNSGLIECARELKARGITHVDVNDNPRARARMSGIMASVALERFAGIETIPHLTPRDSTVVGLESLLLGAHAEGVRNVLCVTGDPPERGDYPSASGGVYQVDAIGLTQIVSRLNQGEDWDGRDIDAPTTFYPGVAVNPTADDLDEELRRFEAKIAAGARFAMTQILFDLSYLERFVALLGGEWPIPVMVGIWPLASHALAVRVHNEVPGIVVPDEVQARLKDAGPNAPEAGRELARELLEQSRATAQGAYVVAPFRQPLGVLDLFA
jgi:methionine synthase I (cobalamin-dependent)/5,10-methylenetetrahydrofolate reductase